MSVLIYVLLVTFISDTLQFFAKKSRDMDPSTALVQGSYNHAVNIEHRLSFLKVFGTHDEGPIVIILFAERLSRREPVLL